MVVAVLSAQEIILAITRAMAVVLIVSLSNNHRLHPVSLIAATIMVATTRVITEAITVRQKEDRLQLTGITISQGMSVSHSRSRSRSRSLSQGMSASHSHSRNLSASRRHSPVSSSVVAKTAVVIMVEETGRREEMADGDSDK